MTNALSATKTPTEYYTQQDLQSKMKRGHNNRTLQGTMSSGGAKDHVRHRQANFLKSRFQVGSGKSDKTTYAMQQTVFSSADCSQQATIAKKAVKKFLDPNTLETDKVSFDNSVHLKKDHSRGDLVSTLQKVRIGLRDQIPHATSISKRSPEEIKMFVEYLVASTGRGPVGAFTKQWCNANDERGLAAHCVEPDWNDWNNSTAAHNAEDIEIKQQRFESCEARRIEQNDPEKFLSKTLDYQSPEKLSGNISQAVVQGKIRHGPLKDQFKEELRIEFPSASDERLEALAYRLIQEKELADAKLLKHPVPNESFRPDLILTSTNRRYKEFFHPGVWGPSTIPDADGPSYCWSCCLHEGKDGRGCESKIRNPDAWCLAHC